MGAGGTGVQGYLTGLTQCLPCVWKQYVNCQRQVQMQVRLEKEQCHTVAREHTVSQPVTRSVSRPLIDSAVFRPSPTSLASLLVHTLSCVYRCLSCRNLQQIRPKNKTIKKRSTFQRALARVRESTQWPGLGVLFACPALPANDREMAMSMSNPSRGPGAAEPLYPLVLPCVYSMCCGLRQMVCSSSSSSNVSPPPPVGRCQRMCQPKWLSPFKTSCRACRACRALVLPPHTSFSPDTAMGPSRITRKLSVVQGKKEVSESESNWRGRCR